jgi:ferredoxin
MMTRSRRRDKKRPKRQQDGRVDAPDCLKCGECVVACPKNVLHL